jgi:hypothetical protein
LICQETAANQKPSAISWHGFSKSKSIISDFIQSASPDWIKKEVTL